MASMGDPSCPVCATADIICGKWTILVIRDLAEGRSRFCELERSLAGISPSPPNASKAIARRIRTAIYSHRLTERRYAR